MNLIALRLLRKLRLLKLFKLKSHVLISNHRFRIPIIQGIGMDHLHPSEPWMNVVLLRFMSSPSCTIIDVGTNIGQTLLKVKAISADAIYIGFEPNLRCVEYTQELITQNQLKNCTLVSAGLSNQSGEIDLQFFSASADDSTASMIQGFRPTQHIFKTEKIQLTTFEDVRPQLKFDKIDIIKIDVEGAELEVLQSLKTAIQEFHPTIIIEILPAYHEGNTERIRRQNAIEKLMTELNYSLYSIEKENPSDPELKRIQRIPIHGNLHRCDYVFLPPDHFTALNKA